LPGLTPLNFSNEAILLDLLSTSLPAVTNTAGRLLNPDRKDLWLIDLHVANHCSLIARLTAEAVQQTVRHRGSLP
jgi:hypothetical protein